MLGQPPSVHLFARTRRQLHLLSSLSSLLLLSSSSKPPLLLARLGERRASLPPPFVLRAPHLLLPSRFAEFGALSAVAG